MEDAAAVARFDRKRKQRTTSNKDWYNPHDPDAKVGRTKHGACDMLHKPEHIVDLESGAIVAAQVLAGDAGDTQGLADRVRGAVETLEGMEGEPPVEGASSVRSLTADKGYHDIVELAQIQEQCGLRTVVGDAQADRRRPSAQADAKTQIERCIADAQATRRELEVCARARACVCVCACEVPSTPLVPHSTP